MLNGSPSIPDATSGKAFDLDAIGQGTSFVQAINDFVIDEVCQEDIPII